MTNKLNKYYWGVLIPVVKEGLKDVGYNGLNNQDVHEFLVKRFEVDYSELSNIEFIEYKENIQQWAAEFLNIYMPDPNEPKPNL